MRQTILIAHNIRSCHNVGSLFRTAEGLGVSKLYLTGYTPYPAYASDKRLPHIARKINAQIHKTALGAEISAPWEANNDIGAVINQLRSEGYVIAGLEQTKDSVSLPNFSVPPKTAIIVGREVEGIESEIIAMCDICVEIPMSGLKESFNVSVAAAIALYHIQLINRGSA